MELEKLCKVLLINELQDAQKATIHSWLIFNDINRSLKSVFLSVKGISQLKFIFFKGKSVYQKDTLYDYFPPRTYSRKIKFINDVLLLTTSSK